MSEWQSSYWEPSEADLREQPAWVKWINAKLGLPIEAPRTARACVFNILVIVAMTIYFAVTSLRVLFFDVPGWLYDHSGPVKLTLDPLRSGLHRLVSGNSVTRNVSFAVCFLGEVAWVPLTITTVVFAGIALFDGRNGKVDRYNAVVEQWRGGGARNYESYLTSRPLPTAQLEQMIVISDASGDSAFGTLKNASAFRVESSLSGNTSDFITGGDPFFRTTVADDMFDHEEMVMMVSTIERFHAPSNTPSEDAAALTVRVDGQAFTFPTVLRWKDSAGCHHRSFLRGLVFIAAEDGGTLETHECPSIYEEDFTCYDSWPSLSPPRVAGLRIEIRSARDPAIAATRLFGCSLDFGKSYHAQIFVVTVLGGVAGFCALVPFLLSKPGTYPSTFRDEEPENTSAHSHTVKDRRSEEQCFKKYCRERHSREGGEGKISPTESSQYMRDWFRLTVDERLAYGIRDEEANDASTSPPVPEGTRGEDPVLTAKRESL